jgi:hypothetical protein
VSHYPYSSEYLAAAPVVEIRLGTPGAELSSGFLEAFVDTRADATLVPVAHLRQAKAKRVDQAALHSQWGERRMVTLYAVALEINQFLCNCQGASRRSAGLRSLTCYVKLILKYEIIPSCH